MVIKRASELWRTPTKSQYVRGEEFLEGWKPRGVSLVTRFEERTARIIQQEEVEKTRQFLHLLEAAASHTHDDSTSNDEPNKLNGEIATTASVNLDSRSKELLLKVLQVWKARPPTAEEVRGQDDTSICHAPECGTEG
jgi:kinesin family protein 1